MKRVGSQPKDTTNSGTGKEKFKPSGSENKGGQSPRQDGKNHTGRVASGDHLWQYKHSLPGEKK